MQCAQYSLRNQGCMGTWLFPSILGLCDSHCFQLTQISLLLFGHKLHGVNMWKLFLKRYRISSSLYYSTLSFLVPRDAQSLRRKKNEHFAEDWNLFHCFYIFSYVQIEKHSRKTFFGDWCVGTTLRKALLLWKNCCKPKGLLLRPVILWCRTAVLWLQPESFLVKMVLEYIQ